MVDNKTQPTILLAMPEDVGIYRLMEKNLQQMGFIVISCIYNERLFRYSSFFQRISVKFREVLLGDKLIKKRQREKFLMQRFMDSLAPVEQIDYAFFIRPDLFSNEFIEYVKNKIKNKMIAYQWDGMDRFPGAWRTVGYFDHFFVFDVADINKNGKTLLLTTNFYFDYQQDVLSNNIEGDFYFIGNHIDGRERAINNFAKYALEHQLSINVSIHCSSRKVKQHRKIYPFENIQIKAKTVDFDENLTQVLHAKVLLDFKTPAHKGLSLRVFEALGYDKKLITTNEIVKDYDFYHPNNILVWDGIDEDALTEFLEKPYITINPEIKQKYSFNHWLKDKLDM